MPYDTPTVQEFKDRFSELIAIPSQGIQNLLDLAGRFIDQTWIEGDYKPALLYLAAHFAVLARDAAASAIGASVGQSSGGGGAGVYLRSISFGDRRIMYGALPAGSIAAAQSATTTDSLVSSAYGQVYLMFLRRNSPVALLIV
jgi:hypothetical protein